MMAGTGDTDRHIRQRRGASSVLPADDSAADSVAWGLTLTPTVLMRQVLLKDVVPRDDIDEMVGYCDSWAALRDPELPPPLKSYDPGKSAQSGSQCL